MSFSISKHQTRSFDLTYCDGVNFALDLQGALVTLVSINDLFELCVADHQVLHSLLVLLQRARQRTRELTKQS